MKKMLLLFNPVAGKSISNVKLGDMVSYYTSHGYIVTAMPLREYAHYSAKGEINSSEYDHTIVTGGDGSLHEAINAGVDNLGYIPCGSANDVAHSLGISMDVDESVVSSIKNSPRKIDLGEMNGEKFVYVAAFGLFTDVPYTTPQKMKKDLGYIAYLLEGIKSLADVKSYHMTITAPVDEASANVKEGDYMVGMIVSSYSIGGFKNPMSDEVALDDGLFEGLFIKKPNDLIEFNEMMTELTKGQLNGDYIDYFKTDRLIIDCDTDTAWTLDGDFGGSGKHFEARCLKQALTIR